MYDIRLDLNGKTLRMNHGTGYDIATISSLTGMESNVNTVQSATGRGVRYVNSKINGANIAIRGYILDGATAAKRTLLAAAIPAATGTLTVYDGNAEYRKIDIVVKTAPQIAQTHHSAFSLTLFAPDPAWEAVTAETITPSAAGYQGTYTVAGDMAADFSVSITPTATLQEFLLVFDGTTDHRKNLYIDFRKMLTPLAANATAIFSRKKDRVTLTVNGIPAIGCVNSQSTLDRLAPGAHDVYISTGNVETTAVITYYPAYSGVVLDV